MNKLKIILFLIVSYFLYINNYTNAAINFTVSPPIHEIDAFTWTTVTRSAQLRNNSQIPVIIKTWKTDFQSNWNTWKPQLVRYSELVHPDQQLSTWINIDTESFTINPNEEKTINFTLSIPNDASPWWHYWAVCFKNDRSEVSNGSNININVDYCILMLVRVDWEVITKAEVKDTIIKISSWAWWWNKNSWANDSKWIIDDYKKDDCPIIDLTSSNYDWKCIDNFFDKSNIIDDINNLWLDENLDIDIDIDDLEKEDFNIDFSTLFINEGNTHLNPTWKVILIDENWKQIKWIWKETIKNDNWAKIWEKIVDYLPINDEWWNVLPGQEREFNSEWKWFPYKTFDENWAQIIKYWRPDEYYSMKNTGQNSYMMIWQRINERICEKTIKANINISYINKDWENVEFNSAQDFEVHYKEKYVWTNPYAVISFGILLLVIYLLWLIFRKKKIKCINCKKKIDKDMLICPYCWIKQEDKRYFKNKKLKKGEEMSVESE